MKISLTIRIENLKTINQQRTSLTKSSRVKVSKLYFFYWTTTRNPIPHEIKHDKHKQYPTPVKEEVHRRATVLLTTIAIVAVFAMLLAIKRHLLIASATHLHHKHNSVAHNKREDEVLKWLWRHHTPYMELETIFRNVPPKGFRFESKLDTLALKGENTKKSLDFPIKMKNLRKLSKHNIILH